MPRGLVGSIRIPFGLIESQPAFYRPVLCCLVGKLTSQMLGQAGALRSSKREAEDRWIRGSLAPL